MHVPLYHAPGAPFIASANRTCAAAGWTPEQSRPAPPRDARNIVAWTMSDASHVLTQSRAFTTPQFRGGSV